MSHLPSIEPFRKRHAELEERLADPSVFNRPEEAANLSREHLKLSQLIEHFQNYASMDEELASNRELVNDPDPEMASLAADEIERLEREKASIHQAILRQMIPEDPADSRNTIVEIRAGAGGDEASLFAAALHRMYTRYAERRGWKVESLGSSVSESGGFKEVSFLISGDLVYQSLKYESGVHRVQRIPVTEAGGRIHTSTATVAVLPEAREVDIELRPEDLEITVSRASGPGGQGVNTTDSAVQILHKPTGTIVTCADERSQLKNKNKAIQVLRSRLLQQKREEEQAAYAANRRSQIGTGDRSERIRTYNFPQSRVTDHRIGLTLHSIEEILEGELSGLIPPLREADEKARLEQVLTDTD